MSNNPCQLSPGEFAAVETLWRNISSHQPVSVSASVIIQGMVFCCLNTLQQEYILSQYFDVTGVPGMFVRDASINRVFLIPFGVLPSTDFLEVAGQIPLLMRSINLPARVPQAAPSLSSSSFSVSAPSIPQADESNPSTPSAKPAKIPRPPNAFILYRKFHHASVVKQNPGLHNNQISVIIGSMWNGESAQIRTDFKAQAEALKLDHLRKHPDYQYRPRKPSEKKKRMSKKKAAALADQAAAKNRAKSLQIVDQYPASAQTTHQPITVVQGMHLTTFPSSSQISTAELSQQFQLNPMDRDDATTGGLPVDFAPSAAYNATQDADMAFFADLDQSDPAFQELLKEVEEAYMAGYYDDVFDPSSNIL